MEEAALRGGRKLLARTRAVSAACYRFRGDVARVRAFLRTLGFTTRSHGGIVEAIRR